MHLPYRCGFKRRNNAVNASLLLNLINNHFRSLNPYLLQKSENLRPHSSNSIENATPSSGTSLLASCKGVLPPPGRKPFDTLLTYKPYQSVKC